MSEEEKDQTENQELFEHYRFVIDPKQTPERIDKYLLGKIEKISRNKIQQAIKAASVLVNEKQIKSNYKVRPHDIISIVLATPPKDGPQIIPEDIPIDIVFEDDDILIVNKPAGMVVHPGIGNKTGTLVNAVAYYLDNSDRPVMEGNQNDRPFLVHRIDKDTSGLLLLAKNEFAIQHLAKQFYDHSIDRSYVALIWGEPDDLEGTIDEHIGRHPNNRTMQKAFPEGEEGKHAITHYKVVEPMYYVSLVECKLETGRTHQIRVHMQSKGHPLFNDGKYGGDHIRKGTVFSKYKQFVHNCFKVLPRQALHARSLGFIHPTSGEEMFFESELPTEFTELLEKWRAYLGSRKELKNS